MKAAVHTPAPAGPPPTHRVLLCSSQPAMRYRGRYYAAYKNFTDFLVALSEQGPEYHLLVPCRDTAEDPSAWATPIELPEAKLTWMAPHRGHVDALLRNLRNALAIRYRIAPAVAGGLPVLYAGPGPNSLLYWLSWLSPRGTRFAFFIRGDAIKTLREIYRGRWLAPLAIGLARLIRRRIRRLTARGRAQVFTFGETLQAQYPGPPGCVHAIAPLIEAGLLRTRQQEGPADHALRILFVGRLSREKNPEALVEACALALRQGLPVHLTLVGAGQLEPALRERIAALGLEPHVTMRGHLPYGAELIAQYDGHHLLCLTSFTEGTPRVVVEAFARGLPVLATPVGSLPRLFPSQIRYIDGFQPADILAGLQWCAAHRTELADMVEQAQQHLDRFFLETNARRVHEALSSMGSAAPAAATAGRVDP